MKPRESSAGGAPLDLYRCLEWRPLDWAPAAEVALRAAAGNLVEGAQVLEVGYHSGMMSLYVASRYGVRVTGYEVDPAARELAVRNAERHGLADRVDFRLCGREETTRLTGSYDAVFLKSVLFHIADPADYRRWLAWLRSVLRPGGVLVALENGRGGLLTRIYRTRVSPKSYARCCLVDRDRVADFRATFDRVEAWHFGRLSPYVGWWPAAHRVVAALERRFWPATADENFVTALVAFRGERAAAPEDPR